MSNWIAWLWLLLAAIFETAWAFSLKWMEFKKLKSLTLYNFFLPNEGLKIIAPFIGYIGFGIANVFFFSLATKQIPLATAFAAWTGFSLLLLKVTETVFFQQKIISLEILFMLMIMIGILGLKIMAVKVNV